MTITYTEYYLHAQIWHDDEQGWLVELPGRQDHFEEPPNLETAYDLITQWWDHYDWEHDPSGYLDDDWRILEDIIPQTLARELEASEECSLCRGTGIGQNGPPDAVKCSKCGGTG